MIHPLDKHINTEVKYEADANSVAQKISNKTVAQPSFAHYQINQDYNSSDSQQLTWENTGDSNKFLRYFEEGFWQCLKKDAKGSYNRLYMQKSRTSMSRTMSREPTKLKVVIVGASGVGKTSISTRFLSNQFNPRSQTTLGASFMERTFEFSPGNSYKIQIWDTTGQEKYRSIAKIYYRDAKIAILVYDVGDPHSFTSLQSWTEEVVNSSPKDVILAVVGNKTDLLDEMKEGKKEIVSESDVRKFAKSKGAMLYKTSAKDNLGLVEMFSQLCMIFYERQEEHEGKDDNNMNIKPSSTPHHKNCCK